MSSKSTSTANRKTTTSSSTSNNSKSTSRPSTTSTSSSSSSAKVVSMTPTSTSTVSSYDTMVETWNEETTDYVTNLQDSLASKIGEIARLEATLQHTTTELNYARGMVKYLAKDLDVK